MASARYAEFQWRTAAPANGEYGAALAQVFVEIITRLEDVKRICDLGCGNGYLAGQLAERGYEVTGVDASLSGIEIATRSYAKARFVRAELNRKLPEHIANEFDLVVSSDVIEHMYRPSDLLEAANSLLEPGGSLLIGAPYHGYAKNLVLSLAGKMDNHFSVLDDGGHIKFFSVKTLSELLSKHGFGKLQFSFYGRLPWLWKNMICHARKGV